MAVDQFCLKWNNFQASIISAFESLQTTQDLADVTLTTEGLSVKAHKIILSACSPYFRTVFKENPCSHPIVILKDILYDDLLAVLNFMYHGEVLVTKDRLHSFLQTAEVLQVSGLLGCSDVGKPKPPKQKDSELQQSVAKRIKVTPTKIAKKDYLKQDERKTIQEAGRKEIPLEKIKVEVEERHLHPDVNENVGFSAISDNKPSILESVLENKDTSSILERSLLSHTTTTGSTSKHTQNDQTQSTSELAKHLSIPRDNLNNSPSIDLSNESCGLIKVEEESIEIPLDPSVATETITHLRTSQSQHGSQCGNCPHCGKTYSNQSALKYHVRLMHSDLLNLYCCHLCPEIFDYREAYKRHMAEIHSLRN
ncbi:longitudinals lacking protein, isoforms H/M/V-like [Onthophagus taurus]|uniref:longitudinals lacking protein, isoforms H/M/V-like n=1 Tax=Onthophagus taurus TaxID=166361 RepID=UPI000C1FF784|nr:longitudinals lacking protein, isoforms H/M/V-like [Onthophagus taurus]